MTGTDLAYAKINISLDIKSKMDDGYHEILSVMQSVEIHDEVTVECTQGTGVRVETNLSYLPNDARNIAAKSALAFFTHTGISGYKTHIRINKRIPVSAGLGGGSSDGAAVLRILDKLFETRLGTETLEKIGCTVGSDIPFCIEGGTKLARGRGEILTTLAPMPFCHIVLCKPFFSFSTQEIFAQIKCDKIRLSPDTVGLLAAIESGGLSDIARRMYNVFEDFLPRGKTDIAEIKAAMLDSGALGSVMTGSGPTVLGLFDTQTNARNAYDNLKKDYEACFLTNNAPKI